MSHAILIQPVTIADFDAFVDAQPEDTKWELVNGQILAMTNPNDDHGQIVANLGTGIKQAADAAGCRTNFGGIRVQASDDRSAINKTIPDITVRCGERLGRTWVTDPVVVVEVLSPSTMDYDRGDKLHFYKSLPSLRDIVIVYQDQVRVEHYSRDGEAWTMSALTGRDGALRLTGLSAEAPLAAIYAGTGLLPD